MIRERFATFKIGDQDFKAVGAVAFCRHSKSGAGVGEEADIRSVAGQLVTEIVPQALVHFGSDISDLR